MAFTPIFPFYEGFLLRATLVTFLNLAFLLALFSFNPRRPYHWATLCGLLLGIAALGRANILVILPVGLVWIWRQLGAECKKKRIQVVSLFLLCTFLAVSPATLHNILRGGRWALVSANLEENWRIGNSYDSTGGFWNPTGEPVPLFSRAFLRLQLKKLGKLISDYEEPNNVNFYHFRRFNKFLRLPFLSWGFFFSFGLAGIILTWPRRRQLFPLHGYLLLYSASLVAFFITSRFRLPLWPVLILFTASAFSWSVEKLRSKKYLQSTFAFLFPSILALFLVCGSEKVIQAQYFDNMVLVYDKLGDNQGALQELQHKRRLYPDDPSSLWKMAYYLQRDGRRKEALDVLENLLTDFPDEPLLLRAAGLLEYELGRPERGAGYLRRYLELEPQAADSAKVAELISSREQR